MNNFYLAKRKLRLAGTLDIVGSIAWSSLVFIIAVYHFFYLIGRGGSAYSSLQSSSSSSSTISFVSTFISTNGYAKFFVPRIFNFIVFEVTLWTVVLLLFLITLFSFLGKVTLSSVALFFFIKARSLEHIRASIFVMLFPLIGGMQAINCYNATTSPLSPKYIAGYSLLRCKLKNLWYSLAFGAKNE